MRVVVVGSGIAGLVVAHRASAHHEVVLVTKSELVESNTRYAQGGIAAALFADDSVEAHIADTLRAGAGVCNPESVRVLCTEGPERVRELIALGVEFDRTSEGALHRGHEAAHSARRVVHAGGDATGLAIETALLRAVRDTAIEVHEHAFVRELVVEQGRVVGVDVVAPAIGALRIRADAVVLASGGAGQLYRHTTNPAVATGDGIAAAWRAGAELADLEFVQFHPTALAVPGSPLVSEAVRGEGAVLRDETGRRFMSEVHPDAELAPRDVVARGIAAAMARQEGRAVLLDATGVEAARGAGFLASRFPSVTRATRAHGFDWTREPVPVTPAAHYGMGGVRTDLDGRSSLPGLFAVGEVACTGVHGANRLASNSLLEALVFAHRAAAALTTPTPLLPAHYPADRVPPRTPYPADRVPPRTPLPADRVPPKAVYRDHPNPATLTPPDAPHPATLTPPRPPYPADRVPPQAVYRDHPHTRLELQSLMWSAAGLERDERSLLAALAALDSWSFPGEGVVQLENRNLLELARLVVRAALAREESRGAHFRSDFPDTWGTLSTVVSEGVPA